MTTADTVTALLHLDGERFPVPLLLPLDDVQRADVHALPPVASSPSAFALVSATVLVRYTTLRLSLAVFRHSDSSGAFDAYPATGTPADIRSAAGRPPLA